MKNNLLKFILPALLLVSFLNGQSQNDASLTNGMSDSFSTDHISGIYKTLKAHKIRFLSVTRDEEPYELKVAIGGEDKDIQLERDSITPKRNKFTLRFLNVSDTDITEFKVVDSKGKVIRDKKINKKATEVSFPKCTGGTYFLEVFVNNRLKKQFNITKFNPAAALAIE